MRDTAGLPLSTVRIGIGCRNAWLGSGVSNKKVRDEQGRRKNRLGRPRLGKDLFLVRRMAE